MTINHYETNIISTLEQEIKKIKFQDHPYDTARDIYKALYPIILQLHEESYESGYDDGFEQGEWKYR